MKEVGKTWSIGDLPLAVTKDSDDYIKPRIGQLGVLDTLYTEQHNMGTEAYYRDLSVYLLSGYENMLLPMIQAGGYNTLISDQGDEGDYYIVACNPTHKQALNKPAEVYGVKLELVRESSPPVPVWPGSVYYAGVNNIYRTDNFGSPTDGDPTWTLIPSTGRGGTYINSFAVDTINGTGELWAKTDAGHIYKYDGISSWSIALSATDAATWYAGASVYQVMADPVTGYIYGFCRKGENDSKFGVWRDIHDGNGFVFLSDHLYPGTYNWLRGEGFFSVYNGTIHIGFVSNLASYRHRYCWSTDGTTWYDYTGPASVNVTIYSWLDPVNTNTVYSTFGNELKMVRYELGSAVSAVFTGINCWDRLNYLRDIFMADPNTPGSLRFIYDQTSPRKLYTTTDKFTTITDAGVITVGGGNANYICPIVNPNDYDMIIYGSSASSHIYAAYGEDGIPVAKAGTAPNNIPYAAGNATMNGIAIMSYTEMV